MSDRKYIRIALSSEDEEAFSRAKAEVEAATGISMTDSMFALSVLRRHINK